MTIITTVPRRRARGAAGRSGPALPREFGFRSRWSLAEGGFPRCRSNSVSAPDRDRAVPGPRFRANSVSAPVGRDAFAQLCSAIPTSFGNKKKKRAEHSDRADVILIYIDKIRVNPYRRPVPNAFRSAARRRFDSAVGFASEKSPQ